MYSDVIVPLDGSPFSEEALEPATFLAAHGHAAVLLVRVHEPLASWDHRGPEWDEFIRSEEQLYLEELGAHRRASYAGDLDCAVIDGRLRRQSASGREPPAPPSSSCRRTVGRGCDAAGSGASPTE